MTIKARKILLGTVAGAFAFGVLINLFSETICSCFDRVMNPTATVVLLTRDGKPLNGATVVGTEVYSHDGNPKSASIRVPFTLQNTGSVVSKPLRMKIFFTDSLAKQAMTESNPKITTLPGFQWEQEWADLGERTAAGDYKTIELAPGGYTKQAWMWLHLPVSPTAIPKGDHKLKIVVYGDSPTPEATFTLHIDTLTQQRWVD